MPSLSTNIVRLPLFAFAAAVLLAAPATAQHAALPGSVANVPAPSPQPSGAPTQSGVSATKAAERMRETTLLIDVVGSFQMIGGETITFTPGPANSNKDSLRVLENLQLERVGQVLDGNKGARQWTISGMITEYRGANYLLLRKAVQLQENDVAAGR